MATSNTDLFDRVDAYDLGADWDIVYGWPQIMDHAVVVSGASPTAPELVAIHNTELDSVEQMVRARVRIAPGSPESNVKLYGHGETDEVGSAPPLLLKAYYAQLQRDTVSIHMIVESEATPVLLATAAIVLDSNQTHSFAFKIREAFRGTQLDVFVDNDVVPVLSYTCYLDKRPEGKMVGFGIEDNSGSQNTSVSEFLSYILKSSAIKPVRPPVRLLTLQDIVYQCQYRLDRSGNSQFPEEIMQDLVNFAQDEVYNELTVWKWAFREMVVPVVANTRYLELPPHVALLYDIRDQSIGYQLSVVSQQDLNRVDPRRERTGTSYSAVIVGMGDYGGPVVELTPVPSSDTVFVLPYYAKPVPMSQPSDLPLIPTNFNEILVFGALKRGSMSDTDSMFMQGIHASWERMMLKMKRQNAVDMKKIPRMVTGNELFRNKATSLLGPVTRAQQLGL